MVSIKLYNQNYIVIVYYNMPCLYYKNCNHYDPNKDICMNGHECLTYDILLDRQQERILSMRRGLEHMTMCDYIRTKQKNDKEKTT